MSDSRPVCPKCGANALISKGNEWYCKECGSYITKHPRKRTYEVRPICPYCGSKETVAKGVPTWMCKKCQRYFKEYNTVNNAELRRYDDFLKIESDSIVITGDCHVPFHCPETLSLMIEFARYFGAKDIILVGDLLELDSFKRYLDTHKDLSRAGGWEYEKQKAREFFEVLLMTFEKVYILLGNHELRMWRKLQASGSQTDVFEIILSDAWADRIVVSDYPFAWINWSWIVAHPSSFSRIQARQPYFLASKYLIRLLELGKSPNGQYGIIDFHAHLGGEGTDVSGRFQVANGMGLFDPDKFNWYVKKFDTYPRWRQGFMILHKNFLYRFPKDTTDWDFWRSLFRD